MMRPRSSYPILAAAVLSACSPAVTSKERGESRLQSVLPASVCVTLGQVRPVGERQMEVTAPAMRAVIFDSSAPVATLYFLYEGPSEETAPLANGEVRRQIGLKLHAENSCNVVYVMWRIEPEAGLAVSVKHNPGKRLHSECGAEGYRSVTPRQAEPVPALKPGEEHFLQAVMREDALEVFVDHQLAWQGELGRDALDFDGPVGVRTDNGRFAFEIAAVGAGRPSAGDCAQVAAD